MNSRASVLKLVVASGSALLGILGRDLLTCRVIGGFRRHMQIPVFGGTVSNEADGCS